MSRRVPLLKTLPTRAHFLKPTILLHTKLNSIIQLHITQHVSPFFGPDL